ncbi:Oxysterol-binding protein-domain-containing protein [Schizophyllum amplum]|uniref:Oxysterol-binding protein-domain-containing protein n=1 Tax=Schizophyllum amplum TaxID=97359 RepID=A0A550CG69_9AGAR|nr:Oxysterol-binding protein-domain-containing protein [Auriculariopsis ampla]
MASPSSSKPTSASSMSSESNTSEPLYQVKLLSAIRSGDPALIHPFLAEIGKDRRKSAEKDSDFDTGAAALHLAVRCASVETVGLLLSHRAISPNGVHPPGSGTTPLHLAASLGRADIVNLLLEQENVDDTVLDAQGRNCRDVARGKAVVRAIDDSRSFLNAHYRSLLHSYILSSNDAPPPQALIDLLDSPRIKFVNLSYLDDDTGNSLLHEAAKRRDLRLIELAVRAGADVFVRNRKGKMAYEGTGKDDKVRVFLRQYANQDTTLIQSPIASSQPPTLQGYLNKYTNVAKGYNPRWFVLKDGVLSYYRHQEDETIASRGSISMKTAVLKATPGVDKLRFEVHSTPSKGHHSGVQKWYMKANHPVEAHRWIQGINQSIEWYKRDDSSMHSVESLSEQGSISPAKSVRGSVTSLSMLRRGSSKTHHSASSSSHLEDKGARDDVSDAGASPRPDEDRREEEDEGSESDSDSRRDRAPHEDTFELQGNSAAAQLDLTVQLLANLDIPSDAPPRAHELKAALREALRSAQKLVGDHVGMAKERDDWWRRQLARERSRATVWEESLATVVREGEELERELRTRSRKRGSRFFDPDAMGTIRTLTLRPRALSASQESRTPLTDAFSPPVTTLTPNANKAEDEERPVLTPRRSTQQTLTPRQTLSPGAMGDDEEMFDTDEEDEFFDAIDANALPNLEVPKPLTNPMHDEKELEPKYDVQPYEAYRHLRSQLPLDADNRPSVSLWSVLKNSIGKDLTKISFPVSFNEPTSMLQRMAEDMEFSECLDVAAKDPDSLRRIAYVAAFGMSNYSSTIGRIAKPFNPMLSETFEYVSFDKEYRYVSEQVSHHPPISACWAESPLWHYYGEVDAKNKFMGKSFEIRPTGVAHAELMLPEEWAPDYPKSQYKGKVVEHYSWKKVTTNVSGFILAQPTIDHYGDMVITNHRTGEQCILTFKPRGWRGRDAYEIAGKVLDASGRLVYEIAGRWNSQLIARLASAGGGHIHPDMSISGPGSPSASPEYLLLWRNSEKPAKSPFNLTPYAITLNDCPPNLKPYVCTTDCRLRPDQRAFELGKWELANDLKIAQEEKQRQIRREREEGRMPTHAPRWFRAETDGDTGERVWVPARVDGKLEYWLERERCWKEGGREKTQWKDVDQIFIEEPESLSS